MLATSQRPSAVGCVAPDGFALAFARPPSFVLACGPSGCAAAVTEAAGACLNQPRKSSVRPWCHTCGSFIAAYGYPECCGRVTDRCDALLDLGPGTCPVRDTPLLFGSGVCIFHYLPDFALQ